LSSVEGITDEMSSQYESLKAERAKYLAAMHKKALKPVEAASV
jgi:dsDNA-specific endonuclease/ATPase MutS2